MSIPVDDTSLIARGDGLWSICEPFSLFGARFGRRMMLLSRNGVTGVLSPNKGLRETIHASLGRDWDVDYLIAPTGFHDTYFYEVSREYPAARHLVSAAFPQRLVETETLENAWPEAWKDDLVPYPIDGMPRVQETVIYDRVNQTLLVSDLVFFFDASWDPWSKTFARLAGVYGKPRLSRLFRMMIKDKRAFMMSLEPLLDLPLRNILPAHGKAILGDGQAVMTDLYAQIA